MSSHTWHEPVAHVFDDAVYLPGHDCLYDLGGRRIDASAHWRKGQAYGHVPENVRVVPGELRQVRGPVVFAGYMPKRQIGHFILESMSRLWVYPALNYDGVALAHYRKRFADYEKMMLDAVLAPHNGHLLKLDRPTLLQRAVVPDQGILLYSSKQFAREMIPIFDLIRRHLARGAEDRRSDVPLFLSRSKLAHRFRRTLGEVELDERLAKRGIQIIYPEQLPISQQLELVSSSRTVVGLHGSALHLTIFRALEGARTISLGTCNPHPNQVRIDRLRDSQHLHLYVQFPIHPRLPAMFGGHSVRIGPYRNFLVPRHTERRLLSVL